MNKFGIYDESFEILINYFKTKPEIEKVVIYGSRAKGTYHKGSDIDFAVWTDNHNAISTILGELDELSTPYKYDLTDYKVITNDKLKQNIDNDGILFFKNPKSQ